MKSFSASDRGTLQNGVSMMKRPNPVFMTLQTEPFEVVTDSGKLEGVAGDFVAFDPISGHVWPVKASYVDQHYDVINPGTKKKNEQMRVDNLRIMGDDESDEKFESSMSLLDLTEHKHKFKRGMLPGGKYVKTCSVNGCGEMEEIDFAEFSVMV